MPNAYQAGRHFLQIPGPSNVPGRILRAISMPTIDHRGPDFGAMARPLLEDLKKIFKTTGPVIVYPASGTGAWEAALTNALSSGDKVLMFETGHFATLWHEMATRLGLDPEFVPGDWRRGADPDVVEAKLAEDREHKIKAVCVVHNETSTGVTSRIGEIRKAMDRANHPALLFVDTISSLASIDYRHEEWGVDVTVSCSQKGLMLPPGLGFTATSDKAMKAAESSDFPKSYWRWDSMVGPNKTGYFPYTPASNMLFGLREAIDMLMEEGLDAVFARHARHGEATRRAVRAWGLEIPGGLEIQCQDEREYSGVLTAVRVPDGFNADELRKVILENFDMSLGNGLSKVQGKVFRIGHLGDFNDIMLCGTLSGVEMGLGLAGIPHNKGGVQAAMDFLKQG
ncbi:MAG: aminotransferase class V-fold PLP-dependent enzyme [Rhodospirillales bacterium]|jgi:alanine-glyoxylate transaminase / serine-glyoxylate transaminase / serine-pyruvate transaminase|nr:aminotransferase class V-fold PLP-dependent enzyme [Rhodospirillales bacterium]